MSNALARLLFDRSFQPVIDDQRVTSRLWRDWPAGHQPPPIFDEEDLARDTLREIDRLIEETRELSEQELLDQVYRRVTIYLCLACFTEWIENPAG